MRRLLLSVALLIAVGVALPLTAADTTAENTTENATDDPDIVVHSFEETVDPNTTVAAWSYDETTQEFTIQLELSLGAIVTITEVVSLEEAGTRQMSAWQENLATGTHEINISADPGAANEAAVIVSTHRNPDEGAPVVISTGHVPQQSPWEQTAPATGWMGGASVLLAMTILAGVKAKRDAAKEPKQVKR